MQIVPSAESNTQSLATRSNGKKRHRASSTEKSTLHLKGESAAPGSGDVTGMIAAAAYFLAEQRGFEPGHELEDWLTAEQKVRASDS
jgi:hypothetical protein